MYGCVEDRTEEQWMSCCLLIQSLSFACPLVTQLEEVLQSEQLSVDVNCVVVDLVHSESVAEVSAVPLPDSRS